ncbi:MAG: PIN domain-containing protein [Coriobacteriales bacterium]|jgi:predicted nucleic acid-binding protein|nr:PIN domain-containing protein [Coriobacteriales bacterium]
MNKVTPEKRRQVVLSDANVIYSRVLRDYLLYSASEGLISITWSNAILDEAVKHLVANVPDFTEENGNLLKTLMNDAYPLALIDPEQKHFELLDGITLPDEGDIHVLAAAIAAEADIICTANTKDFPRAALEPLGLEVMTPDAMLCELICEYPEEMLAVHKTVVCKLKGATDNSTVVALSMAGAADFSASIKILL